MLTFDKQVWWVNMQNLLNDLVEVLQHNADYVVDGKLAKNIVVEKALQLDSEFLQLLLTSDSIKEHFFKKIGNVLVFDKVKFQEFVSNKEFLPNSYTSFKNQIGLVDERGSTLKENKDVVLTWAYKDCVLEGGQDKEDEKRNEIFYNEVLAPDEITRLVEPKVLTNFEKWDMEAVKNNKPKNVEKINENNNLLIKGNNLLALHCLKNKYLNRVKLIYIDPPYNTPNKKNSFRYNDNFNHSTWLTFMSNRLEIAKQLLNKLGVIFISLDDNEAHYCKVLCDEIFGRENFIADICHKSRASISNDKIISANHNHILFYAKDQLELFKYKNKIGIKKDLSTFKEKDENGYYKLVPVDGPGGESKGNPYYEFLGIKNYWRFSKETMQEMYENGLIVKKGNTLQQKYYKSKAAGAAQTITTWWDEGYLTSSASSYLNHFMPENNFNNPKNESLLELIISFITEERDIVLDFFAGSGTTPAVAHKLNRQWIAIEQMDYIKDLPEARLKKVILGDEPNDISMCANWQGGGEFIYCELKQTNEIFVQKIRKAHSKDELISIYDEMKEQAFMRYEIENFDIDCFKKLDFTDAQQILLDCLDKNHLYVNISEIDDNQYDINSSEKAINKEFYKNNGELKRKI